MDINVRKYIKNNFRNDSLKDIKESIDSSISSEEDDPLIGLGVLFELAWNNSDESFKNKILENIKKGM